MKMLGLNPSEQEVVDIPNNIDSRRASSKGSAVSEEANTESILAMVEIHETPEQGISG